MRHLWSIAAALALLSLLLERPAAAHTASDGYVELDVDGARVDGSIDLAVRDLHDAIGLDDGDGALTWREVDAHRDPIAGYLRDRVHLRSDAGDCPLTFGAPLAAVERADGLHVSVPVRAECAAPIARLGVDYRAIFDLDAQHRGLVRVTSPGGTAFDVAAAPGVIDVDVASPSLDVLGFVALGIHHIWAGLDHLLFLLALLLPSVLRRKDGGWQAATELRAVLIDVAQVVTAFTLAHSITLALASLGWIHVSMRLIETSIAISVALAALNNLVRVVDARWGVAFALGLLHGFGFSNVLGGIGLPSDGLIAALLGFNLGVELGQLAIVAVVLPIAYLARATVAYRLAFYGASAAMCLVAVHWSLERWTA